MWWGRFFRRSRRHADFAAEIEQYLEQEAADNRARGMTEDEARAAARRKFGNTTSWREMEYERDSMAWFDAVQRHISYALRQLRRSPGFTATAVLSLALGIGANTAVFQLLNAVRLRSLPVANPDEIMHVKVRGGVRGFGSTIGTSYYDFTNPLWEQFRDNQEAFSHAFAWGGMRMEVGEGADAHRVNGLYATGGVFAALGMQPWRGRLFTDEDDRKGCPVEPVVISHAFWTREFGGEDSAIGQRIVVNGAAMRVIGVTPPSFLGLEVGRSFDMIVPNCVRRKWGNVLDLRYLWNLSVMARLKPGWTRDRAAAHLESASPAWFQEVTPTDYDPKSLDRWRRFRLTADPGGYGVSELRTQYEQSLWLLLGITGLVLLIACGNLANLLLARASARERELAVRLAIGASRKQLVAQLLTESVVLASAGAACAAGVAAVLSRSLVTFLSTANNAVALDMAVDWRIAGFVALAALLACVIFGLAPALRSARADAATALKSGGRSLTADRHHISTQQVLIAAQVSVSFVLVVGAFLFVGSFRNLTTMDTGFDRDALTYHFVDLRGLNADREAIRPMQREFMQRVSALPGIDSVSTSTHVPLAGGTWVLEAVMAGENRRFSQRFTWVSPNYFRTMGMPLVAGRDIEDRDTPTSAKVMVVNERFVQEVLGGRPAIGRIVRSLAEPGYAEATYEIVGVVGNAKYDSLRKDTPAIVYVPETQNPQWGPRFPMLVRSSMPPERVMSAVRKMMSEAYPAAKVQQLSLKRVVEEGLQRERLLAWLAGFFGVLALTLAMVGLYGLISHAVARRRNEVGIRLALGARRSDVVGLFLRRVMVLLIAGLVVGGSAAVVLARSATTLLYGVGASDPWVYAGAALVLLVVGMAATLAPSARAARVNPVESLRAE